MYGILDSLNSLESLDNRLLYKDPFSKKTPSFWTRGFKFRGKKLKGSFDKPLVPLPVPTPHPSPPHFPRENHPPPPT